MANQLVEMVELDGRLEAERRWAMDQT